jgi:Transposase DNA-binding
MPAWIPHETKGAEFGDERLNRRFELRLDRLSEKPTLSIPAACDGWAETAAASRFFDNAKTDAAKVRQPHHDATRDRIRAHPVVVVAQDTTAIERQRPHERVGGPLNEESRWGLYAHLLLAMTPPRVPLGVAAATLWSRGPAGFTRSQEVQRRRRKARPIEEKESHRRLAGDRQTCDVAAQAPGTTVIAVSDRAGDLYECLQAGLGGPAEFISRGCQDRAVLAAEHPLLVPALRGRAALGAIEVQASKRAASTGDRRQRRKQAREARTAAVAVRSGRVLLRAPHRPGQTRPDIMVNGILAEEEDPPGGVEPVRWVLFTSLPITPFAEVRTALDYYCCRWEIEVYQAGCRSSGRLYLGGGVA